MSVKMCDRGDCDNVMCDRVLVYRGTVLYICESCYEELLDYRRTSPKWRTTMLASEVRALVLGFMQSSVGEYREVNTDEEIERLFPQRT